MLNTISVSGFKSLEGFNLELKRGLNIIVGPNGSGKTNIINFLEFLAFLSRDSLLDAVGRSGGAGRIFRRNNFGSLTKKISFDLHGFGKTSPDQQTNCEYEFAADIQLSENNSALYFSRQRIRVAPKGRDLLKKWPIEIEVSTTADGEPETTFHSLDEIYINDRYAPRSRREEISLDKVKAQIIGFCNDYTRDRALYQVLDRYIEGVDLIEQDLIGAQSFNISPSIVRTPEDIASEPEIAQDGRGLAATLFALTSAGGGRRAPYLRYRVHFFDNPERTVKEIIAYSKIVNDAIENIYVAPDTVEAKLRIFLQLRVDSGTMTLPFSLVSDGTAKWFSLVTAIMTSHSIFALEEPENFLHPLMQKEIVKIVRTNFESPHRNAFAVMTTHSETILNCIDPADMILVHMENGRTVARRPTNAEDIQKEIANTGFGAGYYYLAGAIE